MNRLYCLIAFCFILIFNANIAYSQIDSLKYIPLLDINPKAHFNSLIHSSKDSSFYKVSSLLKSIKKQNSHIENAALRYSLDNISESVSENIDLNEAVDLLSNYVRNDSIRKMVKYLKHYIKSSERREMALKVVKAKLKLDSIDFSTNSLIFNSENNLKQGYDSEDLKSIVHYIGKDSVYMWLKKVSCDSVLLSIKNSTNDSINLWINNKHNSFHRFWIKNSKQDSIGAWFQTTNNKSIRIIVDSDVYQQSVLAEKKEIKKSLLCPRDSGMYDITNIYKYNFIPRKWKYASKLNLGFTQGKLANWSEGGESSISGQTEINAFANYKYKNTSCKSTLNYRVGIIQSGDNQLRKNEDLFEINSKFGLKAYNHWYYSVMFNLKTQFFKGYSYSNEKKDLVSAFMSPGYILFSMGLDYNPNTNLSVLISPITAKYTIVSDTVNINPVCYGVEKGEKVKKETGAYVKGIYKWKIDEDIKLNNEIGFFSNYQENPEDVDVDWKMTLEMKINYFICTKLFTHVLYDKNLSQKIQFKEIMNIGVTYYF